MKVITNTQLFKHAIVFVFGITNTLSLTALASSSVSALTYGSSFGLKYDVNSTLDVSLSTNTGFIISDLSAGNSAYSNTVTITVDSNASDGYTLSATVGKTSDNNRNNNRLVHSNNTNYFEGIATDANVTLANLGPNKWGYATYDTTNEIWSNYNGLATVGNAGTTLITSTTPGTKSIDMRIGASANSNQISGTFTNDINFTATARVVTYDYSITYTANNSSTVTNMPSNVTSASFNTGDNVQLSSTTPSATNAISFLGWCDGTVSGTTCTGTLYQPGDYLKFNNASSSTTNAVSLTGVWELDITTIADATNLQEVNACPSDLVSGQIYSLTDTRDGTDYKVAKLADNNCWMLENLALDLTKALPEYNGVDKITLNEDNTNATEQAIDCLLSGYHSGIACTEPYTAGPVSGTWNAWSSSYVLPVINTSFIDSLVNSYGIAAINGLAKVGVYYNYCAVSAGSYCYSSSSVADDADPDPNSRVDIKQDICPKGWRLPSAEFDGEYANLLKAYNNNQNASSSSSFQYNYSTPLSGRGSDDSGGATNQNTYGEWWSSTWQMLGLVSFLRVSSSTISTGGGYSRPHGLTARCILDD